MLGLPADVWQAYWWRIVTDPYSGMAGVQVLLAMKLAGESSTKDKSVDPRDVAPWLAPAWPAVKEARRLLGLPKALRGRSRAVQDEHLRRHGGINR